MRLIDADAVKAMIYEKVPLKLFTKQTYEGAQLSGRELRSMIDELLPTIDAEPVKHGRWIPVDSYSAFGGSEEVWRAHGNPTAYHYCSECKEQSRLDEFGNEILSKYCPDCGAIMDKEEEDEIHSGV